MNAKKQRNKNRRRARKLADQAWDAAESENFDLAFKIIRRAVDLDPGNPLLWNDQGLLSRKTGEDQTAIESFRSAITLAPDFAEAYANLAQIHMKLGQVHEAVVLQSEAVRYAPSLARYQTSLASYQALAGQSPTPHDSPNLSCVMQGDEQSDDVLADKFSGLRHHIRDLNWPDLEASLTQNGFAHIPGFLSPDRCNSIRSMFNEDRLFAKTVTMDKPRFGKGVYCYFQRPIPELVSAIRRFTFPHVAAIVNNWQGLLGKEPNYPLCWTDFRDVCASAGQTTPTPLLLRYEAGGFNAPHQDIRGEVYFPLQLVIILSPGKHSTRQEDGFTGGDFLLCDSEQRKKSDVRRIPAGLGDAVIFCTRERLVRIGGAYGLRPVQHGVDTIESGKRYAIGIPFHEYSPFKP